MQMLYHSDSFVVVRFDVPAPGGTGSTQGDGGPALTRGGFEIVDRRARREIFLEGALAEHFQQGVQALVDSNPTEEALDEFIGRWTASAQQPVTLH